MKKIMSLIAGICISAAVFGQVPPANDSDPLDHTATQMPAQLDKNTLNNIYQIAPEGCVYFMHGKALMVKDGSASDLKTDVSFSNGARITSEGKMTFKDGSTTTLREGQCVRMDGSFFTPGPTEVK